MCDPVAPVPLSLTHSLSRSFRLIPRLQLTIIVLGHPTRSAS